MAVNVAILGAGIGGLSTAHHLAEAGVNDIHVYEATSEVGGKAKSQTVTGGYDGEHGFRFFPHFYRHVVDTMKSIPSGSKSVWHQLEESTEGGIAYNRRLYKVRRPTRLSEPGHLVDSIVTWLSAEGLHDAEDISRFAIAMLKFASSCDERRHERFDAMTWETFTGGPDRYTKEFYTVVIQATRNLAAMRAPSSSAATIASMCMQMIFDLDEKHSGKVDAVLNGPTSKVWLEPWREYLHKHRNVEFHFDDPLTAFEFNAPDIQSVQLGKSGKIKANRFVCAIPLDRIVALLTKEMTDFDPALAALGTLATEARGDMIGAQFYLSKDVPIVNGHIHFPWADYGLTAVSQPQFWAKKPQGGLLSVIISDWERAVKNGKRANEYADKKDLLQEVWRQLEESLPPGTLGDPPVVMHLDDNVSLAPFENRTPLLTHPQGQRKLRPDAKNRIANLYLAADYVRTNVDLASMEGADEAARRAVGAFMADTKHPGPRPKVQPLSEGKCFEWAKKIDEECWRRGLDHPIDLSPIDLANVIGAVNKTALSVKNGFLGVLQGLAKPATQPGGALDFENLKRWERVLSIEPGKHP